MYSDSNITDIYTPFVTEINNVTDMMSVTTLKNHHSPENAFSRMKNAGRIVITEPDPEAAFVPTINEKCFVCTVAPTSTVDSNSWMCVKCSFCSKPICKTCTKVCERCSGMFCSLTCSTINYDYKYDRHLCLSCNGMESRCC